MRLIDSIVRRFGPGEKKEVPRSTIEDVWDAPADYNRATRRRAGLLSKVWRWDIPAQKTAPRYVRRHFARAWAGGVTRRVRKERARCIRLMQTRGNA